MNEYERTAHKIWFILSMLTLTLLSFRVPWWTWTATLVNPENKTISLIAFDVIKLDNGFHYTEVWKKKWSRGKYFCNSITTHLLWRTSNKYFSLSLLWIVIKSNEKMETIYLFFKGLNGSYPSHSNAEM